MAKILAYLAAGLVVVCDNLGKLDFIPAPFGAIALGLCTIFVALGIIAAAHSTGNSALGVGVKSTLVLLVLIGAAACSSAQIQKSQVQVKMIESTLDRVVITGCADAPIVEAGINTVLQFLPPGTTAEAVKAGVIIPETAINALCSQIKPASP